MQLEQIEERYHLLKNELERGDISPQQFRDEVYRLQFCDPNGHLWMIGATTGAWYRFDGESWTQGTPPGPSFVHCAQCGYALKPGASVCPNCGLEVGLSQTQPHLHKKISSWHFPMWLLLIWGILALIIVAILTLTLTLNGVPFLTASSLAAAARIRSGPSVVPTPAIAGATSRETPERAAAPLPKPRTSSAPTPAVTIVIGPSTPAPTQQAQGGGRHNLQQNVPTVSVDSLIREADELTLQSAFDEAYTKYAAAVQIAPSHAQAHARWARALLYDLHIEDGLAKALMATQLDLQNAEALAYLARARDWLGRYSDALAAAQQAVQLNPSSAENHALLAEIYLDMGHADKARAEADQALQLDPNSAEAHRTMAYVLAKAGAGEQAIREAEKAAQIEPGLWMRYDDLATMLRLIGDYEQAIKFYQWAIDLRPKAVSYTGLGLCQIQLNRFSEAINALENAIKLDPQYAIAYGNLALAYAQLKQCDRASLAADQGLTLDPTLAEAMQAQTLCGRRVGGPMVQPTATPLVLLMPTLPVSEVATPPLGPIGPSWTPLPLFPTRPVVPIPPIVGRIAYPIYDPSRQTYDIYLANADGSNRQRIIADASSPDLSPDGTQIAFRFWDPGKRGLYAQGLSGEGQRQLTTHTYNEDTLPKWSPAGNLIVFASRRESDRRTRIYLAQSGGKNDWVIKTGDRAAYGDTPAWFPDGRIIYSGCLGNSCGLITIQDNGDNPQLLTTDPSDTSPHVSRDGSRVAFMSRRDGNWEIYLLILQTGELRRLTADGANDGLPTWSPDGASLAWASDRGGRWGLWIMNADGTNQRPLFSLEGPIDGHVRQEPEFASRGWIDENLSWVP